MPRGIRRRRWDCRRSSEPRGPGNVDVCADALDDRSTDEDPMDGRIAQHGHLLERAQAAGYLRTESLRDLTGRDRYLLAFV